MKIVSITGTKGKTTVTRVLAYLLRQRNLTTLRVDNDGHYINERQKSSLDDSLNLFEKTPSVCPGKYLITMKKYFPDFAAILEASIGSRGGGLGYRFHDIGIFTNIYEDHIQKHKGIKNRLDLAKTKNFIVRKINNNGFLVFNADDKYVCSQLKELPKNKNVTLLPVGLSFNHYDKKKHLSEGGQVITLEDDWTVIKTRDRTKKIIKTKDLSWTFDGFFKPSLYNLLFILGGLYAYFGQKINTGDIDALKKYTPNPYGGRLTLMKNKTGVQIIIDYAHEKKSLLELSRLGHKIKKNHLIGVLRLAPNIRNEAILKIAKALYSKYDHFIIYDKIDGVHRKKYCEKNSGFSREIGEVSSFFSKSLKTLQKNSTITVESVILEGDAIKRAAKIALPGDVVAIIWGHEPKDTINQVKKYFRANLL